MTQTTIRSIQHDIGTYHQSRVALTGFDTKRWIQDDGIACKQTLAQHCVNIFNAALDIALHKENFFICKKIMLMGILLVILERIIYNGEKLEILFQIIFGF